MSNEIVLADGSAVPNDPNAKHDLVHVKDFRSMQDLTDYVQATPCECAEDGRQSLTHGSPHNTQWYGTPDMETTLKMARYGWPEGLEHIKELVKKVQVKFPELFPKQDAGDELIHSVVGAYEDPTMEDSNNPANMIAFKPNFDEVKHGSVLQRIIIETSTSAYISAETYFLRGAAMIALIDQLETYGFRVEVVLQDTTINHVYGNTQRGKVTVFRTVIKRFEDHVDMDGLAFAIANQSFARRLMFACLELAPADVRALYHVPASYGVPCNFPVYLDPKRDLYLLRPLENTSLDKVITDTVELINKRYKGLLEADYNPDLSQQEHAGNAFDPEAVNEDKPTADED